MMFIPGQVMMDPYCPLVAPIRLPDNANLVAPKGGAAGSMPVNTPQVPLSSLAFLLDDFSFQVSITLACSMEPWQLL